MCGETVPSKFFIKIIVALEDRTERFIWPINSTAQLGSSSKSGALASAGLSEITCEHHSASSLLLFVYLSVPLLTSVPSCTPLLCCSLHTHPILAGCDIIVVKSLELFCSSLKSELFLTRSLININEGDENILISYPILHSYSPQSCTFVCCVCVCARACVCLHSIKDLLTRKWCPHMSNLARGRYLYFSLWHYEGMCKLSGDFEDGAVSNMIINIILHKFYNVPLN